MILNAKSRYIINMILSKHVEGLKKFGHLPSNWFWYKDKIESLKKIDESLLKDIVKIHKRILDRGFYDKCYFSLKELNFYLNLILEQHPNNKIQEKEAQIINKYKDEIQILISKYLELSKKYYKNIFPDIDLKKIRRMKNEYFWHVGLTGNHGEIIDSIQKNGILSKKQILHLENSNTGNPYTGDKQSAYVSNDGINAIWYFKNATEGYNYAVGGLPFLVCLKINEFTLKYSYDSDLTQGIDVHIKDNAFAWFAFILTYKNIREFINDKSNEVSYNAVDLKRLFRKYSFWKTKDRKIDIFKIIYEYVCLNEKLFYDYPKLEKLKEVINRDRWNMFLKILINLKNRNDKPYFTRNIAKQGGWDKSYIRRIYVISPSKDKNWKYWAKVMPATKEYLTNWEAWDEMSYKNELGIKKLLPGKGRLLRIY